MTLCAKLAGRTGPSLKDSERDPEGLPPRYFYFSLSDFLNMELNINKLYPFHPYPHKLQMPLHQELSPFISVGVR